MCYLRKLMLFILCTSVTLSLFAQQKNIVPYNQIWLGYANQTRLSNKWGFWAETQLRTQDHFTEELSSVFARIGATYYLNDQTRLTAGYGYFHNFSPANGANIATYEHRPWQQIQWFTRYPSVSLMQWFRLEERYRRNLADADHLDNSYAFNFRMRYNFLMQVPLSKNNKFKPGSFSWILNDEVHVNFGKEVVYNTFDQNRFFTGFSYQTNKTDNIQFGYMNLFQQMASGNTYRSLHTIRIIYFHNLDLRKQSGN